MIVYLAGASHSGSSILDVILNNHSKIFGAGEFHRLSLDPKNRLCSCGSKIVDCEVWNKRMKYFCEKENLDYCKWFQILHTTVVRNNSFSNRINDFIYAFGSNAVIRFTSKFNSYSKSTKISIQNSVRISNRILEMEDKSILVDTSKNAIRMRAMSVFANSKTIFLLRDGRAVIASGLRRGEGSIERCSLEWKKSITRILSQIKKMNSEYIITLKYEQFCDNPLSEINRILKFLALKSEEDILEISSNSYHTIPGNPWLLKEGKTTITISKDERWKKELNEKQLLIFEHLAGKLNRELGYN